MSKLALSMFVLLSLAVGTPAFAQENNVTEPVMDTSRGDKMIAEYFRIETEKLRTQSLNNIKTLDDWKAKQAEYRQQLLEMLGLDPLPEKTDLKAAITGEVEYDDFVVERLHLQSRPGLYVTGNLYRPRHVEEPLPAILYVCGHAGVKEDGVSYGNKTFYQHHGAWFARNGYVCLTIDTLQLGEIEGTHHGTYRENMWWWMNRGYTPAGVEAWNCVRALDYLQSRKEVDPNRIGVTGRSGGGAYSWWIAAIDERIRCAVPVAGITDLQNHVVAAADGFPDGCVEGHCDCMFMLNTYRWDYDKVAALVAPRPLLISNTDSDPIFPLDGVYRTFEKARKIYRLHDAADKIALNVTAGGHKDTQELRIHAFRWFNRHLKSDDSLIDSTAVKYFEPKELRVFDELPTDQKNAAIHETFVPVTEFEEVPSTLEQWNRIRSDWRTQLADKAFGGWPQDLSALDLKQSFRDRHDKLVLQGFDFTSQQAIQLRLFLLYNEEASGDSDLVVLNVLGEQEWRDFVATMRVGFEEHLREELDADPNHKAADRKSFEELSKMLKNFNWAMAYVAPRGIGATAWDQTEFKQTQHRRRFYLLGQTLDGMRVLDVRRAVQALKTVDEMKDVPVWLQASGPLAGVSLYASLFEPIARLDLYDLPLSHRSGPFLLNVRRILDIPQTVAMASENSRVVIYQDDVEGWHYPQRLAETLGWSKNLQLRQPK